MSVLPATKQRSNRRKKNALKSPKLAVLPEARTAVWLTARWLPLGKHKAGEHHRQTFQLQNLLPLSDGVPESWTENSPLEKYPVMFCWHKDSQTQQDVHKSHTSPSSVPHLQNGTAERPRLSGRSRITTTNDLRASHPEVLELATPEQQKNILKTLLIP